MLAKEFFNYIYIFYFIVLHFSRGIQRILVAGGFTSEGDCEVFGWWLRRNVRVQKVSRMKTERIFFCRRHMWGVISTSQLNKTKKKKQEV